MNGMTLIENLIWICVIGVVASVVLLILNEGYQEDMLDWLSMWLIKMRIGG